MPLLTPIGLDPAHPFPRVLNKSLNFAVELEGRDAFGRTSQFAIVQAPRVLPRVIRLPRALLEVEYGFVFLSSILHAFVDELFAGMSVQGCYQFRVTRNSDLFLDEEEIKNLRTAIQGELPQRKFGDAVRLEVAQNCTETMTEFLLTHFQLEADDLYQVRGPVNLVRLIDVPSWVDRPDLKYPVFKPALPAALEKNADIFSAIRKQDILLHHPFESFAPVVDLLEAAADDPDVLAIKMTVYRTGTDSAVMKALFRATQKGKEVTVVVELMARFDEEANLALSEQLDLAGAHVIYGVVGYKTHAKMLLIVRREGAELRHYVHLGTGNYHPRTTRLYTDFGLLTANPEIAHDVNELFKQLTGLGRARELRHLWQAPFTFHDNLLAAIRAEAAAAQEGGCARIIAKMNALVEPQVIEALYEASSAGVRIDLIVRGVCALRPGVPGMSERIRVRSIVGRFLEHHRVFYFHAGGEERVYLSSADWMARNLFRRIEIVFPILDTELKRRVLREGLLHYLRDNTFAWQMDPSGEYARRQPRRLRRATQELLLDELTRGPTP
jgi:polyphosphate kinase